MIKNYLTLAWRQLRKNRGYSFINIFGLATGMAIALIIGIWATDELSYDQMYPQHDRIVQIMQNQQQITKASLEYMRKMRGAGTKDEDLVYTGETISAALNPFIKKGYENVLAQTALVSWPGETLLVSGGVKSISRQGAWTEYSFPLIFGYQFIHGSAESLRDPSTAVISTSTAIALYGTENAIGKTFKINNQILMTVGGVFSDQPANSSFHDIAYFASIGNKAVSWLTGNTDFMNHNCRMYGKLAGNVTAEQATARIKNICTPHVKNSIETYTALSFDKYHLYYNGSNGTMQGGRIGSVRLLVTIGVFILLLACINFMNLSTARSEKRAKEVGIRKTVGSLRSQLIGQFLGESILVAFLAFAVAILLAALSLPWFSEIAGKPMTLPWTSPVFWSLSLAFTIVTGLLAGSYPAFYLSSFRPVKVLKGAFKAGRGASLPRKVLVVAQFGISLSLIIGTVIVFRQIQYAKDRPVGYDRTGLITVPINTDSLDNHYEAVRTALLNTGVVANA
ncbi:MAG TPA: ABC transporter permease, partial [Puia sp.]